MKVYVFGSIKDKNVRNLINEYLKRQSEIKLIFLKEKKGNKKEIQKHEYEVIKSKIKKQDPSKIFLLWEGGKEYTSVEFSNIVNKNSVFIVTGPYGPSEELKGLIKNQLSLGKMTFPHEVAALLLIEQLYRAFQIKKNKPYHK